MKLSWLKLFVVARFMAICAVAPAQSPAVAPRPVDLWKPSPSENWLLRVESASGLSYFVSVLPFTLEPFHGAPCFQLWFSFDAKAPEHIRQRRRILVDLKTGQTVRAYTWPDKKEIKVEADGPITFITGAPEGVPLELFASLEVSEGVSPLFREVPLKKGTDPGDRGPEAPGSSRRMQIRREEQAPFVVMEMILTDKGVEELKVRQKWLPGEKWWREYERYVKGKKDLTAKLMNPPPTKEELAQREKSQAAFLKAKENWERFLKFHPLAADEKLRNRLSVVEERPPVQDLLQRLRKVTGIKLELADNLANHEPDLGSLQLPNMGAYCFMEIIAKMDMENGRWEKIDGGYRLEGTSKALRKTVAGGAGRSGLSAGETSPEPTAAPWRRLIDLLVGAAGGGLVGAAAVIAYRRRRVTVG